MNNTSNFFRASAEDFKKIPGSPVAYWVSSRFVESFSSFSLLGTFMTTREGMTTSNNEVFMRFWPEVSYKKIAFTTKPGEQLLKKWCPYEKGGEFRRWYGNRYYIVNWENDGKEIKSSIDVSTGRIRSHNYNGDYGFRSGITWSEISSGTFSARYSVEGCLFDSKGVKGFAKDEYVYLSLLNTVVATQYLKFISPTLDYKPGHIIKIPVATGFDKKAVEIMAQNLMSISKRDWDSYETSWDFEVNPLVAEVRNPVRTIDNNAETGIFALSALYAVLREKWASKCEEMRRLEIENNRIFIEAYGLQDELTPDVPWDEITLTCNPWYRYGKTAPNGDSNEFPIDTELESRLKGDTVKELISYAVGCMMGRYSIDKSGLILADQGATLQDYWEKVRSEECGVRSEGCGVMRETPPSALRPPPSFAPDEDGIIPILDNDWFADDIVTRFKEFVKVVFGEEHYFENMAWIEDALGKDIRSYFTKDFYKDHLQRYQNRPIYWLFQSPKGAFRALVYMHRYKPDMVGGVLGYLRSLQTKIDNQLDVAMQIGMDESKSASERVRANKDAVRFAKAKKELDEYERNVLYPLSTERIEIDLDDGVKVNYRKFGSALRKVAALEAKGE